MRGEEADNAAATDLGFRGRRTFLAAMGGMALGALHGAPAIAAAVDQKVRFTLDWAIEGPSAPYFFAAERGYMSEAKLGVVVEPGKGSTGAIQAVAEGRFDLGVADLNALVEFKAKNPDAPIQAIYMVFSGTPAAIVTLKRSDYALDKRFAINRVTDLPGKQLGAPGFDAARKMWPMFARANKLDPASVNWMNLPPARRESDLMLGKIDAISGFHYTSLLNLAARGVKSEDIITFRFADHGVPLYGNALVVNTGFAERAPKSVSGFVRAYNRSLIDTIRQPELAIKSVLSVANGLSADAELERLKLCLEHNVVTKEVRERGLGSVNSERLDRSIKELAATFNLPKEPQVAAIFNDQFLPPRAERTV